jgi:hypothetical protein
MLGVSRSVVGADADGGFDLVLDLGEYASGPTSVSLGAFALEREETVVLSPLSLAGATFPVGVAPGETKTLRLTFAATPSTTEAETLCSGDLEVRGSISDTLGMNRPITVTSAVFTPTCTGP